MQWSAHADGRERGGREGYRRLPGARERRDFASRVGRTLSAPSWGRPGSALSLSTPPGARECREFARRAPVKISVRRFGYSGLAPLTLGTPGRPEMIAEAASRFRRIVARRHGLAQDRPDIAVASCVFARSMARPRVGDDIRRLMRVAELLQIASELCVVLCVSAPALVGHCLH